MGLPDLVFACILSTFMLWLMAPENETVRTSDANYTWWKSMHFSWPHCRDVHKVIFLVLFGLRLRPMLILILRLELKYCLHWDIDWDWDLYSSYVRTMCVYWLGLIPYLVIENILPFTFRRKRVQPQVIYQKPDVLSQLFKGPNLNKLIRITINIMTNWLIAGSVLKSMPYFVTLTINGFWLEKT